MRASMAIPRRAATAGTRARLPRVLLCALAALLVAQVGGSASAAPRSGDQLQKIRVAFIPVDAVGQAMYAIEKGFFRRQGIDAEPMVLADGTQTVAAVQRGDAQFAGVPVAALARLKSVNFPARAVAAGSLYEPGVPTTMLVSAPGRRVTRPRDLVGKRVIVDFPNSIAHIGLLRWLKRGGVDRDQVKVSTFPFGQALGPLFRGDAVAALLPQPWATMALQRGARRVALPFDAVCAATCLATAYMGRSNVDAGLAARFRNAVQAAAIWANEKRNQDESARILAKYTNLKVALIRKSTRVKYATRFRLPMAQPWIDLWIEYGMLPSSFKTADLVK
jgi:ABC-type nitrate/sulfonate/bicarbonate transport system substrate-binding protein